jgi:hypothetical protein
MSRENLIRVLEGHSDVALPEEEKKKIRRLLFWLMFLAFIGATLAQGSLDEQIYRAQSEFQPTIKDAIKFSDVPEIKDSVKRISDIKYGITSVPLFPKYQVQAIEAAKLQNEPLSKLYHSLLKIGYAPTYSMPYGELWISNARSKDMSFGAHLKHLSSNAHLRDVGYSGFSDNMAGVFGKRFYKKHTLSGDLNFSQNQVHYYGYDTSVYYLKERSRTRQSYRLIEPMLRLQSHYTDSTHINHDLRLSFYNYSNLHKEVENNVRFGAKGTMFINKEKLNLGFLTDFYDHKQSHDSISDLIMSLSPTFSAKGKKWDAEIGLTGTLDNFRNKANFYFYPVLSLQYDIYESMVIPYAGISGGLIKNSFRSLSTENPFIDTTVHYTNTNNKLKAYGGLKGNISSNTSYDAGVSYSQFDSLNFYVLNYNPTDAVHNQFDVVYDNATLLNVSGQLKYDLREKWSFIAKGNYYLYETKNLVRPFHRPDLDMTFSTIYNLKSKIILRADLFIMGKQWTNPQILDNGVLRYQPKLINGWGDMNLEAEYRYSKMMSFFARFNNIANQRYYRWQNYPSQRFNFMIGLTFVPF